MQNTIEAYNHTLGEEHASICQHLALVIEQHLSDTESKIRHGHPVWFLDGNPVVGYSAQKKWICLLFWSGQSFEEPWLSHEWSFKAAQKVYTASDQIDDTELTRRLSKAKTIQRDYKNIVRRKGALEKLTAF